MTVVLVDITVGATKIVMVAMAPGRSLLNALTIVGSTAAAMDVVSMATSDKTGLSRSLVVTSLSSIVGLAATYLKCLMFLWLSSTGYSHQRDFCQWATLQVKGVGQVRMVLAGGRKFETYVGAVRPATGGNSCVCARVDVKSSSSSMLGSSLMLDEKMIAQFPVLASCMCGTLVSMRSCRMRRGSEEAKGDGASFHACLDTYCKPK
ncbi:hypothetical protein PsorP6_009668 [Peronosclerospora sorghi]|uniref:Uncharacterized protein n=1 Tax=Peronosclerospora sorghi TaxID=230839 RepID=A0ACC0VXH7_9STRA|nr:hypothetical protein PsorP6_009668 [Peronosclerospora sorghi]